MGGMIGANTEELRGLGGRFADIGADRRESAGALLGEVEGIDWVGADRERFVARWGETADRMQLELAEILERIGGEELPRQAREQDEASAGRGGGAGGGAGDVVYGKSEGEQRAHDTNVTDEAKHRRHEGEVGNDADDIDLYDVRQHGIGDCWAMATVAALARTEAGRNHMASHIEYRPETDDYRVTLYEDGEKVDVFVSNSFLDGEEDSLQGTAGDDGQPNYASIYEKALAEHYGDDYGSIWGGNPAEAMETITGRDAEERGTDNFLDISETSSNEIRDRLANGEHVTLSSHGDLENQPIVGQHAYVVTEVRENGDIVVYNPWGSPQAGAEEGLQDGEIVVPADKLDDYFREADSVKL